MHLLVGLGNPGKAYAKTRHNVGEWVIERAAARWGIHLSLRGSATLTYSAGSGTPTTTTVFTETMSATAVKPWSGAGADNPWTVTGSYCEQRTGSNYGAGNACGMQYKGGATLNPLTAAMVATTSAINAAGTSGYVEFWLQSLTLDGSDVWTFQLDAGSGYVTRLSELSGSSHGWQKYHYDLTAGELVSTLKMRFQFTGGGAADDDRIDLDQITLTVTTGGATSWTAAMYDDGAHADGTSGRREAARVRPARSERRASSRQHADRVQVQDRRHGDREPQGRLQYIKKAYKATEGTQNAKVLGEIKAGHKVPHKYVIAVLNKFAEAGMQKVDFYGTAIPPKPLRQQAYLPYPLKNYEVSD